jgi:proton-translocating NADH-quinone oxidoreductase chain M
MLIFSIFLILLVTIIILCFFNYSDKFVKILSLTSASLIFLLSCILTFTKFNTNTSYFEKIIYSEPESNILNWNYFFGLDGISLLFFFLSAFLIFLCIIYIWEENSFKEYAINLFLIEFFLLVIFSTLNLLIFYLFFEAILIPMFLIIGLYGSRARKIRAVYLFFFYTLGSSILLLLGIIYIYNKTGTLNLEILFSVEFSIIEQRFLWLAFFLSFASKIPMFPFHLWLPEAHVEAPTVGSVLLAGILLKLGVYGFLRFNMVLFPFAWNFYSPFIFALAILGILHASIVAIRQSDIKRIVAYSSIAHMNTIMAGLFSGTITGLNGALLQSISHGFVSGGLFFMIGMIYSRFHTRFLYYYGGLVMAMPIFSIFFLLFTLANIALPGTSSFVGEFLLLKGIFYNNIYVCIISATGVILCGGYALWVCNKLLFGNVKEYTTNITDLSKREFIILLFLFFFIIIIGLYPNFFLKFFVFTTYIN